MVERQRGEREEEREVAEEEAREADEGKPPPGPRADHERGAEYTPNAGPSARHATR
jgi:hypothetical protein